MLAEGFLRVLLYREERKFASASKRHKTKTHSTCMDRNTCAPSDPDSAGPRTDSVETGLNQEDFNLTHAHGLRMVPGGPGGLSIPGCYPTHTLDPDFTVCIDNCSLLEQYPDLQVADSGRISQNPRRATMPQNILQTPVSEVHPHPEWAAQRELSTDSASSMPDQGYLVMGASVNISLDLPGSGLEPMSNSVLNGLLEKQLEEVYMQHLTDNLARCNSHLGNSLLHGLVPPPQPSRQPDSLDVILDSGSGAETDKKISYLSTQNLVPYSSNFSSPVLRISETDNAHLQ